LFARCDWCCVNRSGLLKRDIGGSRRLLLLRRCCWLQRVLDALAMFLFLNVCRAARSGRLR
jgi:hypothetical protein